MNHNPLLLTSPLILFFCSIFSSGYSQKLSTDPTSTLDNKIEHADPVYNDFTTDLEARKGTGQMNVNFGYQNLSRDHHELLTQLELEFAPVDNLGFEVLLPYNIYINNHGSLVERPENRLEFFQWSTQYTFLSAASKGVSMAIGFTNILETESPEPTLNGDGGVDLETIIYNPFVTFAKNWQDQYFFTFSGGPEISQDIEQKELEFAANLHTAFHYGFSEKDHYLGVEFNKEIEESSFEMYIRPQVILQIGEKFNFGAAIGIPVGIEDAEWSGFLRLAYEID